MSRLAGWKIGSAVCLLCAATPILAGAQTFTSVLSFNGTDGTGPLSMSLIQGPDGNLYGTTSVAGTLGGGTLFKMTPPGLLTTLHNFCLESNCPDGGEPIAGLLLGTDQNFYGTTTHDGGSHACELGCGTVFKITRGGVLTTLHAFDSIDGGFPFGALVQGADGNFYGETFAGGSNNSCATSGLTGCGTVFKITPNGSLTTLHSFDVSEGTNPAGGLIQAKDGNFYGTTYLGGSSGRGTVFKMTSGGAVTVLHNFNGYPTEGANPEAPLVQASDGNFYGTTLAGGADNSCTIGGLVGCGTVFKITPAGVLTALHNFDDGTDGANPFAPLIQATDGNLYGTSLSATYGTVFKITLGGVFTTLHSFDSTDGANPHGGLLQATNGVLYGSTNAGGTNGDGTIYSEAVGLGPFVTTLPTARKVGQAVVILGTSLTGSTSVTFNGTAAVFTIVSATEIATTVPAGATTGMVQVVTPSETLSSNVPFRVLQ